MKIAVDLGGTKTLVSGSEDGRSLSEPLREETDHDPEVCLQIIADLIKRCSHDKKIEAIGCSVPGPIDYEAGTCSGLNMKDWDRVPVRDYLSKEFSCPVYMEVDTDAGALAEHTFSSNRCARLFYLTISTGIGGGLIVDGEIYRGVAGAHPEAGHQCISFKLPGGIQQVECACGALNCLESISSGSSIKKYFGKSADKLSDSEWKMVGYNIGQGLRNIAALIAPEVIILGGGVSVGGGEHLVHTASQVMRDNLGIVPAPEVKLSELGYLTALYGALALTQK